VYSVSQCRQIEEDRLTASEAVILVPQETCPKIDDVRSGTPKMWDWKTLDHEKCGGEKCRTSGPPLSDHETDNVHILEEHCVIYIYYIFITIIGYHISHVTTQVCK